MITQSSELQRKAEEQENNQKRHLEWLRKSENWRYRMMAYKDRRLGDEYQLWLDRIGHP